MLTTSSHTDIIITHIAQIMPTLSSAQYMPVSAIKTETGT
jgi:hypothetical protein